MLLMTFYTPTSTHEHERQFPRVMRLVSVTPYHSLYFVTVTSISLDCSPSGFSLDFFETKVAEDGEGAWCGMHL